MTGNSTSRSCGMATASGDGCTIRKASNWSRILLDDRRPVGYGRGGAYTRQSQVLLQLIFGNPFGIWVLFIAQMAMVLGPSAGIGRLAAALATGLFIGYAALNGLPRASIFLVYTGTSIASTF